MQEIMRKLYIICQTYEEEIKTQRQGFEMELK